MDLVDMASGIQRLRLWRDPEDGLTLMLDDGVQLTERTEHRYHEALGVVPMLFGEARSIFVGGGGDGLLATRLLRFPEVERITVCDYDPAVTTLAQSQPDLVLLNEKSLLDPRVVVVNNDALAYLERTDERFDLILCDFPDPYTRELAPLYSRETYALARSRLTDRGRVCVQTLSVSQRCTAVVKSTLASVLPNARLYRVRGHGGDQFAFVLAGVRPLERSRRVPAWTRFLDDDVVDAAFVVAKDECFDSEIIQTRAGGPLPSWALLDNFGADAAPECPYNPDHRVVVLGSENPCAASFLPGLVRACDEEGPLLVYLDRRDEGAYSPLLRELGYGLRRSYAVMRFDAVANAERIRSLWDRIDNGSVRSVQARHCKTSDDPELSALFREYLDQHGENYLDVPETRSALDQHRLHFVTRDAQGEPVSLMVLVTEGSTGIVDVLHGRRGWRQNMLGLLLSLRLMARDYVAEVQFGAATLNIESLMTKLGAVLLTRYDVYVARGPRS